MIFKHKENNEEFYLTYSDGVRATLQHVYTGKSEEVTEEQLINLYIKKT